MALWHNIDLEKCRQTHVCAVYAGDAGIRPAQRVLCVAVLANGFAYAA